MKSKIFLVIAFGTMLFVAPSCKKSLEEEPYSSLSSANVYSSEDGLKKATFGIYDGYVLKPWLYQFFYYVLTETGHQYSTFGTSGAFYDVDLYYRFAEDPKSTAGGLAWTQMYTIISRCNSVIANANKAVSDEAVATKYVAEARLLRGYAYFNLVRLFGDVPIVLNEITSLSQKDDIFGARQPVETVYNTIMDDMKFGEANLPDKWTNTNDIGRVTAGIAKALLGKVYITMAGKPLNKTEYFAQAADKLKEIVGDANEAKYGFGLLDNFADVFASANERNKELVLTFGMFYNSSNTQASIMPFFLLPFEQNISACTYKLYQLYEATDDRRDVTLIPSIVNANDGHQLEYRPADTSYYDVTAGKLYGAKRAGIGFGKYQRTFRDAGAPPWGYNTDYTHMRFTDALLLLGRSVE
ncbi:MAG: RagB/SusD family nutrient uptake outer membrane protein [Agriterribacter sp.]